MSVKNHQIVKEMPGLRAEWQHGTTVPSSGQTVYCSNCGAKYNDDIENKAERVGRQVGHTGPSVIQR